MHEVSILLFLKIKLENDSSLPISSDYSSKMNISKIYPQVVDYGQLPFVLNNLGNLGSAKQTLTPPLP